MVPCTDRVRRIRGTRPDAFELEPPTRSTPSRNLANSIWTPHAGGTTGCSVNRIGQDAVEHMAWISWGVGPRDTLIWEVESRRPFQRRSYPAELWRLGSGTESPGLAVPTPPSGSDDVSS